MIFFAFSENLGVVFHKLKLINSDGFVTVFAGTYKSRVFILGIMMTAIRISPKALNHSILCISASLNLLHFIIQLIIKKCELFLKRFKFSGTTADIYKSFMVNAEKPVRFGCGIFIYTVCMMNQYIAYRLDFTVCLP